MNPKLLKILIYISGVIALFVFLSVRIVPEKSMNFLLKIKTYPQHEDSTKYSELFYINMIKDFQEDLPPAIRKYRNSDILPSLGEADIIIYGDSHFDHSRQLTLPELLSQKLNEKVYYYRIDYPYWGNALAFLKSNNYISRKERIFVYGSAERYIPERFENTYESKVLTDEKGPLRYFVEDILFPSNAEFLYSTILKRSYLTHDIYVEVATLKFHLLDYISMRTPEYRLDKGSGSWLFFDESVDHFSTKYTEEQIQEMAINIKDMADRMKNDYNLDFIFLPVPEKYSVYYKLAGSREDYNFLPSLYHELDKLKVPYIDLYSDFIESDKILFHRTDTHWNANGVEIALEKLLKNIKSQQEDQFSSKRTTNENLNSE